MKTLFDKNFRYTDVANTIDNETKDVCKDIMNYWVDEGYSPREITYIMQQAINDLALARLLGLRI